MPNRTGQVMPNRTGQVMPNRTGQVMPNRTLIFHIISENGGVCKKLKP